MIKGREKVVGMHLLQAQGTYDNRQCLRIISVDKKVFILEMWECKAKTQKLRNQKSGRNYSEDKQKYGEE